MPRPAPCTCLSLALSLTERLFRNKASAFKTLMRIIVFSRTAALHYPLSTSGRRSFQRFKDYTKNKTLYNVQQRQVHLCVRFICSMYTLLVVSLVFLRLSASVASAQLILKCSVLNLVSLSPEIDSFPNICSNMRSLTVTEAAAPEALVAW